MRDILLQMSIHTFVKRKRSPWISTGDISIKLPQIDADEMGVHSCYNAGKKALLVGERLA